MNYVRSALALMCVLYWETASSSFHDYKERHHDLEVNGLHSGNSTHKGKLNEREASSSYYTLHDPYQHRREFHPRDRYLQGETSTRAPQVFRTQGKGTAEIGRGQYQHVPNAMAHKNGMDDARVKYAETRGKLFKNGKAKGHRRACKKLCPPNRTVVAMKGQNYVVLPNPCVLNRWIHYSGPAPGTKVYEGTHTISGTLAPTNKFCEYQYQVIVRSCEELMPQENDTMIECTNGRVWGSTCTVSCGKNKRAHGATELECNDSFAWSNPMPTCRVKAGCPMPKIKSNSRVWCQTADLIPVKERILQEGSSCRFYKNGRVVAITCKNGVWRGIRKIQRRN